MSLIIRSTIWTFSEVPPELNNHFVKEVQEKYYENVDYIDHSGIRWLPTILDIVGEMRYHFTIESSAACEQDNVPFKEDYWYNTYIVPLDEEEQEAEITDCSEMYFNGLYDDTKLVLDTLYLSYYDGWTNVKDCEECLFPNVEVW